MPRFMINCDVDYCPDTVIPKSLRSKYVYAMYRILKHDPEIKTKFDSEVFSITMEIAARKFKERY